MLERFPFSYRVALLLGLMMVAAAVDYWRRRQQATRYREYGFICIAGILGGLFGFANDGLSLNGIGVSALLEPLPLGVALGLFLGKQIGVFAATFLAVTLGLGRKPTGATWLEIWGLSLLCGVGFTMSLFIGALAFPGADPEMQNEARLGVAMGSLLSAAAGMMVLSSAGALRARREAEAAS